MVNGGRDSQTVTFNETVKVLYFYSDVDYDHSTGLTASFNNIVIIEGSTPPTTYPVTFPAIGKNLLPDNAVEYGSYGTDGGKIQEDNNKYRRLSIDLPAGNYVFSTDTTNCYIIRLLIDNTVVGTGGAIQSKNFTLTATANVKIAWRNTDTSAITETLHNQIETGSAPTEYEPFDNTVYGGTLKVVSGVLTVEWAGVDLGSKSWTKRSENTSRQIWEARFSDCKFENYQSGYKANAMCSQFALTTSNGAWTPGNFAPALSGSAKVLIFSVPAESYASATECKQGMTGIIVAYELTTPYEIQLTPQQITALIGNNTVWSDANGEMTAVYLKKG